MPKRFYDLYQYYILIQNNNLCSYRQVGILDIKLLVLNNW